MNPKKTGEYILKKRKDKKITQQELAELLNVTNKAVSRWETGEGYPDISLLPQIAIILQCSVDDILAGEDINKVDNKKDKKIMPLGAFTLTFTISIIFILFTSILISYASYFEWIGATLLGISCLGCSIAYIFLRLNYLNKCQYSTKDKKYIFINTLTIYSTTFLSLLFFSVLVFNDPNLTGISSVEKSILTFDTFMIYAWLTTLIVGLPLNVLAITTHYLVLFKRKAVKHFFIGIAIILVTLFIISFNGDSLMMSLLPFELIISLIVLLLLKFIFKKNIKQEILILVISFTTYYILNFLIEQFELFLSPYGKPLGPNDHIPLYYFEFDGLKYLNAVVNPAAPCLLSFSLLGSNILAAINIKKNKNKLLNSYIIFITIVFIILTLIIIPNITGYIHFA